MVITAIQYGVPFVMEQNVPYALPVHVAFGFCTDSPNMDLQVAMTWDTSGWTDLIDNAVGEFITAAPFIRTTHAAGRTILVRRFQNSP